jgi:hypothetical protein
LKTFTNALGVLQKSRILTNGTIDFVYEQLRNLSSHYKWDKASDGAVLQYLRLRTTVEVAVCGQAAVLVVGTHVTVIDSRIQ